MKARIFLFAVALTGTFISCNEYYDDIPPLGNRVEALEDSIPIINSSMNSLNALIKAIENNGYITDFEYDENSKTWTLHLSFGDEKADSVIILKGGDDGVAGDDAGTKLGIAKAADGKCYWTFGDDFLRDGKGNLIPVQGEDGKDAGPVDGDMPQIKLSGGDDPTWLISNDGGKTYTDTGWKANGKDGEPGAEDPVVIKVYIDPANSNIVVFRVRTTKGEIVEIRIPKS